MMIVLVLLIAEYGDNTALAKAETTDQLAYYVNSFDGKPALRLFDPESKISEPFIAITEYVQFLNFNFGADGSLAFSANHEGNSEIYVWDAQSPNGAPVNISKTISTDEYSLDWSPNGHYLAYESYIDRNSALIYLWDGNTTINITPNDLSRAVRKYYASWSLDGRLAFTAWYDSGDGSEGDRSEIYLWDGESTVSLSQNPTGQDQNPVWNTGGQLAFLSARNGDYDLFVWDGVSMRGDLPDITTFTNIAPDFTHYYSYPEWTNEGLLTFLSNGNLYRFVQIYLWNGKTATNISQNFDLHNGSQSWTTDGRWVFSTFFSSEQLVYVRDNENNTILSVKGEFPRWSPTGYLTFCRRSEVGWELLLWDGENISSIAQGREIWGQWRGGTEVYCTSG